MGKQLTAKEWRKMSDKFREQNRNRVWDSDYAARLRDLFDSNDAEYIFLYRYDLLFDRDTAFNDNDDKKQSYADFLMKIERFADDYTKEWFDRTTQKNARELSLWIKSALYGWYREQEDFIKAAEYASAMASLATPAFIESVANRKIINHILEGHEIDLANIYELLGDFFFEGIEGIKIPDSIRTKISPEEKEKTCFSYSSALAYYEKAAKSNIKTAQKKADEMKKYYAKCKEYESEDSLIAKMERHLEYFWHVYEKKFAEDMGFTHIPVEIDHMPKSDTPPDSKVVIDIKEYNGLIEKIEELFRIVEKMTGNDPTGMWAQLLTLLKKFNIFLSNISKEKIGSIFSIEVDRNLEQFIGQLRDYAFTITEPAIIEIIWDILSILKPASPLVLGEYCSNPRKIILYIENIKNSTKEKWPLDFMLLRVLAHETFHAFHHACVMRYKNWWSSSTTIPFPRNSWWTHNNLFPLLPIIQESLAASVEREYCCSKCVYYWNARDNAELKEQFDNAWKKHSVVSWPYSGAKYMKQNYKDVFVKSLNDIDALQEDIYWLIEMEYSGYHL